MQLYCPSCQAAFSGSNRCPSCGERLVTPSESFSGSARAAEERPELVRPTVFGRILVGCLVALGLFFGLHEWAKTAFDWLSMTITWQEPGPALLTVVLRLLAVAVGGLLAGAGRAHGSAPGAMVGLICGGLFLFVDVTTPIDVGLLDGSLVAALTVLGAVAGHFGGHTWPPPLELPDPLPDPRGSSLARLVDDEKAKKKGKPTLWIRVVAAAVIVVAGLGLVDLTRLKLKGATNGVVNMGGVAQAPVVDLEFAVMMLVGAGIWAGANTGAGFRHGLLAGLLAGTGGVAVCGRFESIPLITEGLHQVLDLALDDMGSQIVKLRLFLGILTACTLGGWLGGQMFPPIVQGRRLRSFD